MTKDVYDVKKYATFSRNSFSWKFMERPNISRILGGKLNSKTKVIEAGCGDGRTIEYLCSQGVDEANVIGIDLSKYLIDQARENLPGVKWLYGSISDRFENDITKGETDIILCTMVLDYLDNDSFDKFLGNCQRWLKTGGELLIIIPHPIRMIASLDKYYVREKSSNLTPWGEWVVYYHRAVSDYVKAVIKWGFNLVELDEPEPLIESKEIDPENYQKYTSMPCRLLIHAVKK